MVFQNISAQVWYETASAPDPCQVLLCRCLMLDPAGIDTIRTPLQDTRTYLLLMFIRILNTHTHTYIYIIFTFVIITHKSIYLYEKCAMPPKTSEIYRFHVVFSETVSPRVKQHNISIPSSKAARASLPAPEGSWFR